MAFWGQIVKPGKVAAFVPPPDGPSVLHLSQATLGSAESGSTAAVSCKVQDGEKLLICRLKPEAGECCSLDLLFDQYTEFRVEGSEVHLTGYYMPQHGMEYEDDDEDEEEEDEDWNVQPDREGMIAKWQAMYGSKPGMEDLEDDSDEDGSEEGDSEDDSEDDFDSDEDEDMDSEDEQARARKPSVLIEDVQEDGSDDEDDDQPVKERKPAQKASKPADGTQKAQQAQQQQKAPGKAVTPGQQKAPDAQQAKQAKQQQQQQPASDKNAKAAPSQKAVGQNGTESIASTAAGPVPTGRPNVRRYANGFEVENVGMGQPDGKLAKPGKKVVVKYCGQLQNGKVFDETKGNKTFTFRLGVGEVIKGWDKGVEGMRVGDKRKLSIPPQMGYGSTGVRGTIPPNATLLFDVELVNVK
ncbi:hypothetical protein WJX72_010102 [[Myrmecia] bisecta]|uniref:FK506-binding protein n=1 Tax=[Myrmecia] bisecta TaxID=41462 RepID=A0AAW1PA31_9CHLO